MGFELCIIFSINSKGAASFTRALRLAKDTTGRVTNKDVEVDPNRNPKAMVSRRLVTLRLWLVRDCYVLP